eukprot:NODE_108_length_19701_cov_0.369452.p2 type:complete len:1033 gc:universal NODE_108_length_19701_cov_0.369452:12804-9706(-)
MNEDERLSKVAAGRSKFLKLRELRRNSKDSNSTVQSNPNITAANINNEEDVLCKVIRLLNSVSLQHSQELQDFLHEKDKLIKSLQNSILNKHFDNEYLVINSNYESKLNELNQFQSTKQEYLIDRKNEILNNLKSLDSQIKQQESIQLRLNSQLAHSTTENQVLNDQLSELIANNQIASELINEQKLLQQSLENQKIEAIAQENHTSYNATADDLAEKQPLEVPGSGELSTDNKEQIPQEDLVLNNFQEQINKLKIEKDHIVSDIQMLNESKDALTCKITELNLEKDIVTTHIDELLGSKESLTAEVEELTKIMGTLSNDVKEFSIDKESLAGEIRDLEVDKNGIVNDIAELTNLMNEKRAHVQELNTDTKELTSEKNVLIRDLQELSKELNALSERKHSLNKMLVTIASSVKFIKLPSIKQKIALDCREMPTIPIIPSNIQHNQPPVELNGLSRIKELRLLLSNVLDTNKPSSPLHSPVKSLLETTSMDRLDIESSIHMNKSMINELQIQHDLIITEYSALQDEYSSLAEQVNRLNAINSDMRGNINQLNNNYDDMVNEEQDLQANINDMEQEIQQLNAINNANSADYKVLQRIKNDLEMDIKNYNKGNSDLQEINKKLEEEYNDLLANKTEFTRLLQEELDDFKTLLSEYGPYGVELNDNADFFTIQEQCNTLLDVLNKQVDELRHSLHAASAEIVSNENELKEAQQELKAIDEVMRVDVTELQNKIKESNRIKTEIKSHKNKLEQLAVYKQDVETKNNEMQVEYMELIENYKNSKNKLNDVGNVLNFNTSATDLEESVEISNLGSLEDSDEANIITIVKEILVLVMNENDIYMTNECNEEVLEYLKNKQDNLERLMVVLNDIVNKNNEKSPQGVQWNNVEHHVASLENLLNEQLLENSRYKVELNKMQEITENVDLNEYMALKQEHGYYEELKNKYNELLIENKEYQLKIAGKRQLDVYKKPYMRELYYRKDLQYQKQYLKREYQILSKKWELVEHMLPIEDHYKRLNKFKSVVWLIIGIYRLQQRRFQ